MRELATGSWRILSTAWRMDWRKTAVSVILMVAGAASGPLTAAGLGWMTDEIVARRPVQAALAGIVVAALAIVALTFSHFAHIAYFELSELANLDFDEQLIALSNGSPGIAHHENIGYANSLTVLLQESRQFRAGLEALLNGISLALAIALTGVLLALQSPLLLLLPLAALVPLLFGRAAEHVIDRTKTATAESTRVALHLLRLSTSASAAGELRVFRLRDEVRRRHHQQWAQVTTRMSRAQATAALLRAGGQVVFALAYVAAVLLVLASVIRGHRSVGDVVLVITLAAAVNQQVTLAVTVLQNMQRLISAHQRLDLLRLAVTQAEPQPGSREVPAALDKGIELDRVSFSYPGSRVPALRDTSLTIPAGSVVAVVGENGAGKSTLINLLCGFYQPSAGRILVDGTDLRLLDLTRWRQRIAAGFQDFARYEFIAQHTVGVGELSEMSSAPAVLAALGRARSADLVSRLPHGLATQLGKSYAEGAELSGGQWQKLALGRAYMREAPLLLVLDEPTSALDPAAEHALFEQYAEQARRAGRAAGAITVLVSHRFTTLRVADLIVVVSNGEVVETGSHEELIASGGLYAEMFAIQASAYR
jgi:ATP-binding cassette, subfamily B, bacterial